MNSQTRFREIIFVFTKISRKTCAADTQIWNLSIEYLLENETLFACSYGAHVESFKQEVGVGASKATTLLARQQQQHPRQQQQHPRQQQQHPRQHHSSHRREKLFTPTKWYSQHYSI